MVNCCKATKICCCLKYVMCIFQFILTLLYFLIENILTVITFILSFSCFYYKLRWRLYTRLNILDSSNPLQRNFKTKSAPKSPKTKSNSPRSPHTNDSNRASSPKYSNSIPEQDENDNAFIEMARTTHKTDIGYEVKYDDDINDINDVNEKQQDSEYKTIKVLTQNLWVHYLAPSPCKTARIKAFISFLTETRKNDYDILIIQEIFGLRFGLWIRCNDLEYLVCELYKIGYIYSTKPSGNLPYFGQNGGVILFSKYPLVYDDVFIFNKSDEIMLRKGFAIAITKIVINSKSDKNDIAKYYHLCVGTCHCDPYRPHVILSQIQQFSQEIKCQFDDYKNNNNIGQFDIIVGGDFNTRNKALTKGLKDYFEDIISMYNAWTMVTNDRKQWNEDLVTYRSAYIPKYRVWLSILTFGLFKLPTLNKMTEYKHGYCLDHLLTNIDKAIVDSVSVVDSRYKDMFVSDHLGVELVIKVKKNK